MGCDEIQMRISDCLDEGRPLGGELRSHLDACPTCAAFAGDLVKLDGLLAAGRLDAPLHAPRRRIRPLFAWFGFAAAAAAVAAFIVLPALRQNQAPPPGGVPLAGDFTTLDPNLGRLAADAVDVLAMNPYRRELDSLAADARLAVDSLLTFVPTPAAVR